MIPMVNQTVGVLFVKIGSKFMLKFEISLVIWKGTLHECEQIVPQHLIPPHQVATAHHDEMYPI
jgi:hypothetical protein